LYEQWKWVENWGLVAFGNPYTIPMSVSIPTALFKKVIPD
jgi:hypothetical protein